MALELVTSRRSPHALLPGVNCLHPEAPAAGILLEGGVWHDVCRTCGAYWPENTRDRKPFAPWPQAGNPLSPEAPGFD